MRNLKLRAGRLRFNLRVKLARDMRLVRLDGFSAFPIYKFTRQVLPPSFISAVTQSLCSLPAKYLDRLKERGEFNLVLVNKSSAVRPDKIESDFYDQGWAIISTGSAPFTEATVYQLIGQVLDDLSSSKLFIEAYQADLRSISETAGYGLPYLDRSSDGRGKARLLKNFVAEFFSYHVCYQIQPNWISCSHETAIRRATYVFPKTVKVLIDRDFFSPAVRERVLKMGLPPEPAFRFGS